MVKKTTVILLALTIMTLAVTCKELDLSDENLGESNDLERRIDGYFHSMLEEALEKRCECRTIGAKCGKKHKKCCSHLCLLGKCTECGGKQYCKTRPYEGAFVPHNGYVTYSYNCRN